MGRGVCHPRMSGEASFYMPLQAKGTFLVTSGKARGELLSVLKGVSRF